MRRSRLAWVIVLWSGVMAADHFPANLIARGPAEHTLGPVDVYHTKMSHLRETLGQPASLKKYPEVEDSAEVVWNKGGLTLHANINVEDVAFAVDVRGEPNALARTGRGLSLGGSLADATRIYGTRYIKRGDVVTFQWRDETELRLRLKQERILSMQLVASEE